MSGYNRIPWNLIVIFLIISAGISAVGYSIYDYQTEQIKTSKQNELSAVSVLKVNEITRWHQEIVDDGISLYKNKHFVSHVEHFSQNPDNNESRQDVIVWMKSIQENKQYKNTILFDSSGNMLISLPDEMADTEYYTKSLVEDVIATNKIVFSDFHRIETNGEDTHIEMLIPLVSQDSHESLVGVLVIGIDHTAILDKIILSRPMPSESSESLIVHREGDNVIFLNELRYQKDTALSLSIPISQAELPAAMAVAGTEGIVEGIDYRGVEVLSFVRAIPDTPWFMITKVDANEIYAPIHIRALYLSFIVGALIVFSGIGIGLFWQHQNTQLLNIQKKSKYTRDLIETSLDILLSISPDGNIIEVNKATERITGISRKQLIGTDFSDYFTEPDMAKKAYQAVLDEGIIKDRELAIRHVSGDTTHLIFNETTYLDEAGNIQYIFAAGRDITELKRAENSLKKSHDELEVRVKKRTVDLLDANVHLEEAIGDLRSAKTTLGESERRLLRAQEVAHVGDWEYDVETSVSIWSDELYRIYGLIPKAEITLEDTIARIHPDDRDYVNKTLAGWIENGVGQSFEYRIVHPDGLIRYVYSPVEVVRDSTGKVVKLYGIVVDVTERMKAEIESILNSSRMAVLAELGLMINSPFNEIGDFVLENGVTLTESEFGFVGLMNEDESVFTIYSCSKEAMVGCDVDDKPIEYPIKDAGIWGEAVRQRKSIVVNDYLASDLDKKEIFEDHLGLSRLISVPIFDGDKIVAVAAMANKAEEYTDSDVLQITLLMDAMWRLVKNTNMLDEIRQLNVGLEDKVSERTSELMAVNKELEAFSYSVSHDLRAPLRSVDGFSLALLEDYEDKFDETGKDYINRVRNATKDMSHLIDDLLSLSRITRGEVEHKEVNLSELALDIAEKYKFEEPERQMDFVIGEGVKTNGDERLLRAMFENLISNACKFTSKEPIAKIEFGITCINDENVYYVRDNGVGFDMKFADKLFGAFQRLHSKSEFPGTGIGLATVQRIIHKHGGHIWAESELGKGATFYFTI